MKKAYVIGAGPLGLSAAVELINSGYQLSIIDSLPYLGGLANSFDFDGDLVDYFYHFYYWGDHHLAIDFLSKFADTVNVHWDDINSSTYVDSRFVNFDSYLELLKLGKFSSFKIAYNLLLLKLFKPKARLDCISAIEWSYDVFGREFTDKIWLPLIRNKFGVHAGSISAYWLATRIKRHMSTKVGAGGRCRFGYLTDTYRPYIEAIKNKIIQSGGEIYSGHRLNNLLVSNGSVTTIVTDKKTFDVSASTPIFSCMPLGDLSQVGDLSSHLPYLKAFNLVGAVVIILKLSKKLSDSYWTTVSDDRVPFNAIIQQNRLYKNSSAEIVYLSRYYDRADAAFALSDEALLDEYIRALHLMFPHVSARDILKAKVIRSKSASPVPCCNFLKALPPFKSPMSNLYHAGYEHIYPEDRGVGNSILVGQKMVREFLGG